jgi:SAM-dependent methyltransferase
VSYPDSADSLRASPLFNSWWYYSVELLPGIVAKGQHPDSIPMLPRINMRRVDLRGSACLDIGSMEGLMSVLMMRGGASRVLAIDGIDHCLEKMDAVRHYCRVAFDYQTVGPMYDLAAKLPGEAFDFINCSGLLYHVVSPLTVLTGLRPLLKRNALMIVSTNVVVDEEPFADFNAKGRLQAEPNTFWYLSTGLLDYALRYLRLAPLATAYQPHDTMATEWRMQTGKRSGYLSVLCRAVDEILPANDDDWMADSASRSWEYEWLVDWERAASQPLSSIRLRKNRRRLFRRVRPSALIDVTTSITSSQAITAAASPSDSHLLRLSDHS